MIKYFKELLKTLKSIDNNLKLIKENTQVLKEAKRDGYRGSVYISTNPNP